MVRVAVIPGAGVAWLIPVSHVAYLVRQHVLLHVTLGREPAVTDLASERPLLGVTAVVDIQRAFAGEGLVADAASCACLGGTSKWITKWGLGWNAVPHEFEVQKP